MAERSRKRSRWGSAIKRRRLATQILLDNDKARVVWWRIGVRRRREVSDGSESAQKIRVEIEGVLAAKASGHGSSGA
jgi:hypothetical protein